MSDVQATADDGGGVATADDGGGGDGGGTGTEEHKPRFTLPSAYTILFALIVLNRTGVPKRALWALRDARTAG